MRRFRFRARLFEHEQEDEHENDFLHALLPGRFELLLVWLIRALVIGWFLYAGSLSALTVSVSRSRSLSLSGLGLVRIVIAFVLSFALGRRRFVGVPQPSNGLVLSLRRAILFVCLAWRLLVKFLVSSAILS
jgi:small-conductance mechanosensitive channel